MVLETLTKIIEETIGKSEAKKILWFPVTSRPCEEYRTVLIDKLLAYTEILEKNKSSVFQKIGCQDEVEQKKVFTDIKILVKGIDNCLVSYLSGNQYQAYLSLFGALNKIKLSELINESIFIKGLENEHTYYRIRKGKKTEKPEDFYHISFTKYHLCKDDRFNIKGYPCLYLSYSKDGCKKEMNYSTECDSIASFQFKSNNSRRLFDLSWCEQKDNQNINLEPRNRKIIHILWPLIAACKSISRYCNETKCECTTEPKNFKIEYVIPQMLAEYVQYNLKLDGIFYFTVREDDFNPTELNMQNVILFTKPSGRSKEYDMDLLNEFDIQPVR